MLRIPLCHRYLLFPVRTGAPKIRLALVVLGKTVREFDIEFAATDPAFLAPLDVTAFLGVIAELKVVGEGDPDLAAVHQADEWPGGDTLYREALRPQFHFTSRCGWLNDPNGLVYHGGLWHLYYQHNPYGWNWGNMHWGHAVSEDLVHWRELGIALYPHAYGDWAFSGSGFVTADRRLGIAYTSTGRGECLAFSEDGGMTFTEIPENPVVRHRGRDPKVFWHQPSQHWVMAVYDEFEEQRWIAIYTSTYLDEWTFASRIGGFYECPELFPLGSKWVLYGADAEYLVGDFDGREFHPTSSKQRLWHGDFYASQTYTDPPDGRRIQIGWGRGIAFPGMPFNQQMGIACELSLVDGSLRAQPVRELAALRQPSSGVGELLDVETTLAVPAGKSGGLSVRGIPVVWDRAKGELTVSDGVFPLAAAEELPLRVLVDRGSVEVFVAGGRMAVAKMARPSGQGIEVLGEACLGETQVFELGSIW